MQIQFIRKFLYFSMLSFYEIFLLKLWHFIFVRDIAKNIPSDTECDDTLLEKSVFIRRRHIFSIKVL